MSDVKTAGEINEEASKPLEESANASQTVTKTNENKGNIALYVAIAALALVVLKVK